MKLHFGLISSMAGIIALTLSQAQAQTIEVIKDQLPVATIEIASGVAVQLSAEHSRTDTEAKHQYYRGHALATFEVEGKPVEIRAEEMIFRP